MEERGKQDERGPVDNARGRIRLTVGGGSGTNMARGRTGRADRRDDCRVTDGRGAERPGTTVRAKPFAQGEAGTGIAEHRDAETSRRMRTTLSAGRLRFRRSASLGTMRSGQLGDAASRRSLGTGRIHGVQETNRSRSSALETRPGLPMDESRLLMMRRVKAMSVEQRLQLFERLSRDAAWIRSAAKRIR